MDRITVERIEKDLAAMHEAIADLANEFHKAYSEYLTLLGQAVRQQLILACYHVCTQGYPERFLRLPYNQRYELQQTLRRLAYQTQEELLAQLHPPVVPAELSPSGSSEFSGETTPSLTDSLTLIPSSPSSDKSEKPQLTPAHLAQWQQDLEEAIAQELRTASHAANRLLQQANILPPKLPEPILEAAARADMSEVGGRTPNLMNLLVEAVRNEPTEKDDNDQKGHTVIHIVAIHLRLAEIEFADPAVNSARTRIRSLLAQLKNLGREYQKKQHNRAIAEAQAAWRASWTEE
ncbi:hypothetical protein J5X98_17990 [Leptothermofonsia sichuanensis E412]|uniref:hypothetical protein n=1 Tax=Leptothermofonsia sichuanensis TaxID=2917832 RepID=UPI001CA698B5|nr:hypothetical protein [Leptothermofonsia sichuanensis]QZZ19276.1 hypothetical protein J5X98_17990 [Leptothermofonsia sichuanensis E412]